MNINEHGHVVITPAELLSRAVANPTRLINDVLVPGTPHAFPSYRSYCDFVDAAADALGVNPRCVVFRGSSKIGYSIAPKPGKAWCAMNDGSDIDLAVIDPDYYHTIDREVRHRERKTDNMAAVLESQELAKQFQRRQKERQHYLYRDYNLPSTMHCAQVIAECSKNAPIEQACGLKRTVNIFVYRDWLSLIARYQFDLQELSERVDGNEIARGVDIPRPANLTGIWTVNHPNGNKAWDCSFAEGWPEGEWKSWHDNGHLQSVGSYIGDKSEGTRDGEWTWHAPDGTVQAKGTFHNGRPQAGTFKEWHGGRRCYVRVTYVNGRKTNDPMVNL